MSSLNIEANTTDFLAKAPSNTGLGAKLQNMLRAIQRSRMQSALNSLTDAQLELVGISRAEIPEYATKLID